MEKLLIDEDTAHELCWAEEDYQIEFNDDILTIVQSESWTDEGKYQYRTIVFKYKDKYYTLNVGRTGSYYTEYYYDYDLNCPEVKRKERVITETYYE